MDKRPKGMSNVTATPSEVAQLKRRSLLADYFIRLVREKPLGTAGAIIVLALLFAGIFADFVATHDPNELIYRERNAPTISGASTGNGPHGARFVQPYYLRSSSLGDCRSVSGCD